MAGLQQVLVQAQQEAESTWASSEPTDFNTLSSKDDAADSSSFAATNVGEPQVDSSFDQVPPSSLQITTTIWYSPVTQMRAPRIASYASNTELVQNAVLANPGSDNGFDMTETDDDDSNNGYASIPPFFLVFLVSLWCLSV